MYKIITAEEHHVEQLVPLLASTGYWDLGLKYNKLGISNREFMREAIVKPHLPFTDIIVTQENDAIALGVIVCATKSAISAMPESKYNEFINPQIANLFKNMFNFELTESYHISFLAVSKSLRGKGFGIQLLEHAEKKATSEGCENLSLYTASCQTSAIKLYHRFGMMITKAITISNHIPFPCFLYFEKNKTLATQHDYFDTEEYQKLEDTNFYEKG